MIAAAEQTVVRLRWIALSVLFVSSALNYLDRSVLSALMPTLAREFQIDAGQLGTIVTAFSIPYAVGSPLMGMLIHRIGLRWGASFVVAFWSAVSAATGLAGGLASLMMFRAMLGLAESGGIPTTGKGSAVYLQPRDRAMGSAISQIGITLGIMGAPILTEFVSARYGWRSAFVVAGLLGFVWVPIWLWTSARIPAAVPERSSAPAVRASDVLKDFRFLALVIANALAMSVYSLWTTWTTYFLVRTFHLTQRDANLHYAWIPPIFATLGGLAGGIIAQRLIRQGREPIWTRVAISMVASIFALSTGLAPMSPGPAIAVACVCLSYFSLLVLSVNYYSIPLDLFGPGRAAFATSFLVAVYGLMQAFLAPLIGRWSDAAGWTPVCAAIGILPLASTLLLRAAFRR